MLANKLLTKPGEVVDFGQVLMDSIKTPEGKYLTEYSPADLARILRSGTPLTLDEEKFLHGLLLEKLIDKLSAKVSQLGTHKDSPSLLTEFGSIGTWITRLYRHLRIEYPEMDPAKLVQKLYYEISKEK